MTFIEGYSIDEVYLSLVNRLLTTDEIINETKEITNCCLTVHNPTLAGFSYPMRKISMDYVAAEMKWYWSADNSCKTIGQHAKMWLAISDDGETSNSAYGYIIFKKYDIDQLQQVVEVLRRDNSTRRAVLNISDPAIDRVNTKDMQCTIAIQFLLRNGKLEETVYMRSNDVYFGLPYDYIFFVSLGQYVATKLGVELSVYNHVATSMHMYVRDIGKFKEHNQGLFISYKQIIKENYHEID